MTDGIFPSAIRLFRNTYTNMFKLSCNEIIVLYALLFIVIEFKIIRRKVGKQNKIGPIDSLKIMCSYEIQ